MSGFVRGVCAFLFATFSWQVLAAVNDARYNFPTPATKLAEDVYGLHTFMLVICLLIFVVVFGVMFYSIYKHRKSKGAVAATFHESTKMEILWTLIPFLIVIGMALPATKTVIAMKDTSNADLTVKVTGYQWKWGYDYLKGEGEGIAFLSALSTPRAQIEGAVAKGDNYLVEVDNPLVVPVGKKVRIITTADDVIHAWAMPDFAVRQDAIPGFVRDTWFRAEKIGTYRGQCAELCGKEHAFMPIVVEVKSEADYKIWAQAKAKELAAKADDPNKVWEIAELRQRGEKVYANCVACHQATGQGVPNTFPPLIGDKVVLGDKAKMIQVLLKGQNGVVFPKGQMPAWDALSDVELAAVATYVRTSWGNKAEAIQPQEFKAARK